MEGLGILRSLAEDKVTEERVCPRDGSVLESKAVGSAEVFVCGACHGLSISGYDMASLLRAPFESWKLPWAEKAGDRSTTVDNTVRCLCSSRSLMKTVSRQGVAVDLCPDCGALWCDGGELEELIRRKGGRSYAREGSTGTDEAGVIADVGGIGLELLLDVLFSSLISF